MYLLFLVGIPVFEFLGQIGKAQIFGRVVSGPGLAPVKPAMAVSAAPQNRVKRLFAESVADPPVVIRAMVGLRADVADTPLAKRLAVRPDGSPFGLIPFAPPRCALEIRQIGVVTEPHNAPLTKVTGVSSGAASNSPSAFCENVREWYYYTAWNDERRNA
jgi:hypothetical protein